MEKKDFIKIGVMAIAAIFLFVVCIMVSSMFRGTVNNQLTYISQLNNEIEAREAAKVLAEQEREEQIEAMEGLGLDTERVDRDTDLAEKFLLDCMSWDSYAAYDSKRTNIATGHQLRNDSRFMTLFLPPRWSYPDEETLAKADEEEAARLRLMAETLSFSFDQRTYNRFGSNPMVSSFEPYVAGISTDGTYSYVAVVKWSNMQSDGSQQAYMDIFTYSISEDGTLSNPDAYIYCEGSGAA